VIDVGQQEAEVAQKKRVRQLVRAQKDINALELLSPVMDAMYHAGSYRPQKLGRLAITTPADEVHAVVFALSQGDNG
jgi:hypothetical protein